MTAASTRALATRDGARPPERDSPTPQLNGNEPLLRLHEVAGNRAVASLLAQERGAPLDPAVRHDMEAHFGRDLIGVRVHTGAGAAASAAGLGAAAYTVGQRIVFGAGRYRPDEPRGRALLAHELAHVLQQARGGSGPAESAGTEQAADASAAAVLVGGPAPAGPGAAVGVARQSLASEPGRSTTAAPSPAGRSLPAAALSIARLVATGRNMHWLILGSAMRGFVTEMGGQLTDEKRQDELVAMLRQLLVAKNRADLENSFGLGVVAGLVSPVTDLLGIGVVVERLWQFAEKLELSDMPGLPELAAELRGLADGIVGLNDEVKAQLTALAKDPLRIVDLLDAGTSGAMVVAEDAGRSAARSIVDHLTGKDEDSAKPRGSALTALSILSSDKWTESFSSLQEGGERLVDAFVTTPWGRVGYSIGRTIGSLVVNVVIALLTGGVGNVLVKAGALLGKIAPILANLGKFVEAIGMAIKAVDSALDLLTSKALKRFEAILRPLLNRLKKFFGKLEGIADRQPKARVDLPPVAGAPVPERTNVVPLGRGKGLPESPQTTANKAALAGKRAGEQDVTGIRGAKDRPVSDPDEAAAPVAANDVEFEVDRKLAAGAELSSGPADPYAVQAVAGGGKGGAKPSLKVVSPQPSPPAAVPRAGPKSKGGPKAGSTSKAASKSAPADTGGKSAQGKRKRKVKSKRLTRAEAPGVYAELDQLQRKFPGLRRYAVEVRRRGAGAGMWFEGVATGTPGRGTSFDAVTGSGKGIQLDDLTPDGKIIDAKDWTRSPAEIRRILYRWERRKEFRSRGMGSQEPGYEELDFEFDKAAVAHRAKIAGDDAIEKRLDDAASEMTRQALFAKEAGLPGKVEWRVNNPDWKVPLEKAKGRVPPRLRGRIEIEIVP